jgi:hypothetical protein
MKMNPKSTRSKAKTVVAILAATIFAGGIGSAAMAQGYNGSVNQPPAPGNGVVPRFDNGYLDHHPDVAQQLAANPALVDNGQFMALHPGLREYLAAHSTIKQDLKQHPYRFMGRENQLNGQPYAYGNPGPNGYGYGGPNGYGYGGPNWNGHPGPTVRFDNGYLDHHPDVAQQLSANPALVDNGQFMESHPGLREYLANHPGIRQDLKQHPYRFMGREDQTYGWQGRPGKPALANTDRYFDQHPDVQEQINRNPKLIDNPQFVESHPGLDQFLHNHPYARQQWQSHPYRYMHREDQYGRRH